MNTSLALTSFFVGGLLIGNLAVMADRSQRDFENQPVANKVTAEVTNTVSNTVTETEVYKIVCVAPADGYCKEYSVRKITKE